MFTEQTIFRTGENTHWKIKDGEGVVVDFTTGNYFVLDDVCSFFWKQLLEKPRTMPELVTAALDEYEADPAEVTENVRNFCDYIIAEKLAEAQS